MTEEVNGDEVSVDFESFKSALPETTQGLLDKAGVKDFDSFSKDYETLTGLIGKKGLMRPEEGADEETINKYTQQVFKEMGIPDDGVYNFDVPEQLQSGDISQELLNDLATIGVQKGITPGAFQGVVDSLAKTMDMVKAKSAESFGTEDALKKEWGESYQANNDKVEAFIEKVSPEAKSLLGLPAFKKFAMNIAKSLGEDKMDTGEIDKDTKMDLQKQAKEKTAEAILLRSKGKYNEAAELQREAHDLLAKSF